MKRFWYFLAPAAVALLLSIGGTARAESYGLKLGTHGFFFGFNSGHGHYGHNRHYKRRHDYKRNYHYKRYYWSHPRRYRGGHHRGYRRHGGWHQPHHYWRKYRHRGYRRHGWRH